MRRKANRANWAKASWANKAPKPFKTQYALRMAHLGALRHTHRIMDEIYQQYPELQSFGANHSDDAAQARSRGCQMCGDIWDTFYARELLTTGNHDYSDKRLDDRFNNYRKHRKVPK